MLSITPFLSILLFGGCDPIKDLIEDDPTDSGNIAARDSAGDSAVESLLAAVPRIRCADGVEDCSTLEFTGLESEDTSDRPIDSYTWDINGDIFEDAVTVEYDFSNLFAPSTLFEGSLTVTDDAGDTNTSGIMLYALVQTDECEETGSMVWNKLIKPGFSIGGQCVMQSGLVGGCFNPDQTYSFSWTDSTGTETELVATVDDDKSVIRTTELIDPGTGQLKISKTICDDGSWIVRDYCFEVTCDPTAVFTITYSQVSCSR